MFKNLKIFMIVIVLIIGNTSSGRAGIVENTEIEISHRTISVSLIKEFLKRWEINDCNVENNNSVTMKLKFKDNVYNFRFRIVKNKILIMRLENWFFLHKSNLNFNKVMRNILVESSKLTVGKITWNPNNGEVGIEHALVVEKGIAYRDFIEVLVRLLVTADVKYKLFMRTMWR